MSRGRYYQGPVDLAETTPVQIRRAEVQTPTDKLVERLPLTDRDRARRLEAQLRAREEAADRDTGRISVSAVPPARVELSRKEEREFRPSDPFIVKTARTLWLIGGLIVTIVLGTIMALGWLDDRVEKRMAPLERRIERLEEKADK